jgi:hypothetical protein
MQDDYPADGSFRPRFACARGRGKPRSGRLFLCASCRVQVIICSCCDRGQVYCNSGCSARARRRTVRDAGQRYQASLKGRRAHAARMSRYRARRQRVTHHSSPAAVLHDLLPPEAMMPTAVDISPAEVLRPPGPYCRWCGCRCLPLLRLGFIRRRRHRGRAGAGVMGVMGDGDPA